MRAFINGLLMKFNFFLVLSISLISCGGGGGNGANGVNSLNNSSTSFSINSSKDATYVGSSFSLSWSINGYEQCSISGDINQEVTSNGNSSVFPLTPGEYNYSITCNSETKSISINVLPEYISVPDIELANALTRLGYPVIDGQMAASDALNITNFIITSEPNSYGEADSNGITTFSNPNVPDSGAPVTYTSSGNYITDTRGIESFLNLRTMRLEKQHFSSIDISKLKKLTFLSLWSNPILSLDVSYNTNLTHLGLSETGLTSIDTSNLSELIEAAFQQDDVALPYTINIGSVSWTVNGFSQLDFSQNTKLQRVYLHANPLTNLGFGENNKNSLREIWAFRTNIQSLDLRGFSSVSYVILSNSNNLTNLNLTGINSNNPPFRFYCDPCANLNEVRVTNVSAYQQIINDPSSSSSAIYIDSGATLIEGP
tara:strand:- start:229 stop:1512 length:1284 start_codon:yes stop_codon:yes gene_type:complete